MRQLVAVSILFVAVAAGTSPEPVVTGYLGGSGTDDCDGIAVDRAGNLYLACHSDSPDFPHLPAKAAPVSRDSMDAVVVKVQARTGRIVWATRTGGRGWDAAGDIEVGKDGSVYVLGQTESADFPTTADAVQRNFGGLRRDIFFLRLNSDGRIVYSTLLGGSRNDEPSNFALAEDGTVYVCGVTWSSDFPGPRVALFGPGGSPDGFIARFRPGDPNSLRTVILGGSKVDHPGGLALDGAGNLFITGFTASADFPLKNALQSRLGGEMDAFVAKIRLSDWSLLFSSYLGGGKLDAAFAVAMDPAGNPVVSGVTASSDFITTAHAFQQQLRGTMDAFVTKLDRDLGRVLWSTHYGGSTESATPYDGGNVAVDTAGRVWVAGMTAASDLPTRNALQPAYGGGDMDGFLAAFSADGSALCYGSYAGGSGHDLLEGLAIGKGVVYASGITSSANLAQKAWQAQNGFGGGPFDAFVVGVPAPACR